MRKIVLLFFAALFMTVPAMAVSTVDITCTVSKIGDANWVTVSYESDPCRIRAFGLDITVDTNKIRDVNALNANYRIYPGQIVVTSGKVTDYNTPCDPCTFVPDGNTKVTIEMGSLYTMDPCYTYERTHDSNLGYGMQPELSGQLLRFRVGGDCNYVVDVNARRGGIVMEDLTESVSLDSPLCSGKVPPEGPTDYYDFGDAPQSYSTKLADVPVGPSHIIITGGPILGAFIDAEADGQPSVDAILDDTTGVPDDEDGVVVNKLVVNEPANSSITVTVSQAGGKLNGWIDWGNDGSFAQPIDYVVQNVNVVVGQNILQPITVPAAGVVKNHRLYSRWRISTTGSTDYYGGPAANGEVEDYNDVNSAVVCHVPDCVNDVNATAQAKLIANGFTIGTITTEVNAIPAGNVISTDPVYCNYPNCGSAVNMLVSKGPPTISGTVSGATKSGVTLSGLPSNPVTDVNGNYTGTVSYGWSGTVTPTKTGYTFVPVNRSYSNVTSNYTAQNYVATANPLTISGKVTEGASNLAGVTIVGLPGNPVTGADGNYTSTAYYGWSGLAMPSKGTYTFSPVSKGYTNITANQTQNYAATAHATECMKNTDPNYAVWSTWGKPNCWCFKRQCRGDADGVKTGGVWVQTYDLNLLKSAFNKADTIVKNIPNGICADLNHAKTGGVRVQTLDLNILKSFFNKAESSVPCCDFDKNCIFDANDKYNFWTN